MREHFPYLAAGLDAHFGIYRVSTEKDDMGAQGSEASKTARIKAPACILKACLLLAMLPTVARSQQEANPTHSASTPTNVGDPGLHLVADPTTSSGPGVPSADLELRVRDLEALISQMQAKQQGTAAASAANLQEPAATTAPGDNQVPTEPPTFFNPIGTEGQGSQTFSEALRSGGFGGWTNNGFFVESPNKEFVLRITGQIQADYREFLRTKDRTDIDTFLVRRARLGIEATLFKYYDIRLLPDFGNGQTIIQDAYINVRYGNDLQLEVGRFKQPISYEQLIQDRYVPTLERSIIDQLVPQRDLGAMIHGEDVLENRLDYAVSISNGEINGNSIDTNNHKDVDARVATRPLNVPDNFEWLRYFGIGVSGGFGIEQEPINPSSLKTPDTVTYFTFNSTVRADGLRTRLCPELTYFYGPVGFLAEYYEQHQDMRPSATGPGAAFLEDVPFRGYVLLGTCFVTGEKRTTYSQQTFPVHNFDARHPISNPGAWELVARVSHLDAGDIVYSKGAAALANPATTANVATEFTVGFNWYLNPFVRMQFNYEHDMFNRSVLLGPSIANDELRSQDTLITRFQVAF